jgi:hypothetical protein
MMTYVFSCERKAPLTFDANRTIIGQAGKEWMTAFQYPPACVEHVCGYKLAQNGQGTGAIWLYLWHRNTHMALVQRYVLLFLQFMPLCE